MNGKVASNAYQAAANRPNFQTATNFQSGQADARLQPSVLPQQQQILLNKQTVKCEPVQIGYPAPLRGQPQM